MNMMMKKTAVAVALGLALGLTACGGGGGDSGSAAAKDMCQNIAGMQTTPLDAGVSSDGVNCTVYGADPKAADIFKANRLYQKNWAFLDLINAEYAYERGAKGAGVAIVISDNGIWQNHVELQGKVIEAFGTPAQFGNSKPYAHGSSVASAAAGYTVGVAPESPLVDQASSGFRIVETTNPKAKIYSLSAGWVDGYYDPFYNPQSRANFVKNDMMLVQGAGNEGVAMDDAYPFMNNNPGYPMFDPDTKTRLILVGGTATQDPDSPIYNYPGDNKAYQQSYITSPVCGIYVAVYDLNDPTKLATVCGTSIATPTVSGVAAIVRGMYPSLSSEKVVAAILNGANKSFTTMYSDNTCGKSKTANCGWYYFGHGLLDVKGALQQAEKML